MKPGQLIRSAIPLAVGVFLTFTLSVMAQVKSETTKTIEAGDRPEVR